MNSKECSTAALLSLSIFAPALAHGASLPPRETPPFAVRCPSTDIDERGENPQGTQLWGVKLVTDAPASRAELQPLLTQVALRDARFGKGPEALLKLQGLRLVAAESRTQRATREVPSPDADTLIGAMLIGRGPDGTPVDLTICDARPSRPDGDVWLYQVRYLNPAKQVWQNICAGTSTLPKPYAVAVSGVWNKSGARRDAADAFTFGCETGVIAKCVLWGYKIGQSKAGQSLTEYHQACTRMARADYCGDGVSHTAEGTQIDIYDALSIQTTARSGPMTFEAAWSPDGAHCLNRTRHGISLVDIQKECPARFLSGVRTDLGNGDTCMLQAKTSTPPLVYNRSEPRQP